MAGYFASLIGQSALDVGSPAQDLQQDPLFGGPGDEDASPLPPFEAAIEETVEIAAPRPVPTESQLPPGPERREQAGRSEPEAASADRQPPGHGPLRGEELSAGRAGAAQETADRDTRLESLVESTSLREPVPRPAEGTPAARAESRGPAEVTHAAAESIEAREDLHAGREEPPAIEVVESESRRPPEHAFDRARVWHETYRLARNWVATSGPVPDVLESMEQHVTVEPPARLPAITIPGRTPARAAAEVWSSEPPAAPELHVSIGSISVVVEEPAARPETLRATPPTRPEPAAPPDWTRRHRLYLR